MSRRPMVSKITTSSGTEASLPVRLGGWAGGGGGGTQTVFKSGLVLKLPWKLLQLQIICPWKLPFPKGAGPQTHLRLIIMPKF